MKPSVDPGAGTSAPAPGLNVNAAIGWGILFLLLVAGTDIPLLQTPAAMLAWLFFVAVLLLYGPTAFGTVKTVNTKVVPSGGHAVGGTF